MLLLQHFVLFLLHTNFTYDKNPSNYHIPPNYKLEESVLTLCPERYTVHFCHKGSVDILWFTKYFSWICNRAINSVPNVNKKDKWRVPWSCTVYLSDSYNYLFNFMIFKIFWPCTVENNLSQSLRQPNTDILNTCSHEEFEKENLPGVIQLESNLSSFGKVWPFNKAFLMLSSASFAVLQNTVWCA